MQINERFSANLISSSALDKKLVSRLDTNETGDMLSTATLSDIADKTRVNLTKVTTDTAGHARPSMLAHLSSFAKNVEDALASITPGAVIAFTNLSPIVRQDFAQWQGMTAAVALNNVLTGAGLDLTVSPVTLDGGNVVHKCVLLEMQKDGVYKQGVTTDPNGTMHGYLYYICQSGKPFAVFHPDIGLCAMKNYDLSIFDGILDWYDPDKGWKLLMDPETGVSLLDDFCLRRIEWWAKSFGRLSYAKFVHGFLKNPDVALSDTLQNAPSLMANAANIDNIWPGKGTAFGSSIAFYTDAANAVHRLPKLFNNEMLLTSMTSASDNRLIYNTPLGEKKVCFKNNPPTLQNVAPVAPFRKEFVSLLDSCKLEDLSFEANVLGGNLLGVAVDAAICNSDQEVFHIHKYYDSDHLRLGKLPYMMIWPYIPLPQSMNLWKEFYATWQEQSGSVTMVKKADNKYLPMASNLTFDFEGQGVAHDVYRYTAAADPWKVCKGSKPFQYALVNEVVNGIPQTPWGVVFLPEYKTYNPNAVGMGIQYANGGVNTIRLAVDFGTTSTVSALRSTLINNGDPMPLPYEDYSRTVTCEEADGAKKLVDQEHWLGMGGSKLPWQKKIFSVAQLFGPHQVGLAAAGTQQYYINGRMFLISPDAMVLFGSAAGESDPLTEQKILNDMKFNETMKSENYLAASLYLAGIYIYAVLYLLSNKILPVIGTDFVELRVSYPNEVTMGALSQNWNYARGILNSMMDSSLTSSINTLIVGPSQFFSEATATTAYLKSSMAPVAVGGASNLVSLDIGGGTTDISISSFHNPSDVRKLSFRYAGREIVVTSIIEYFRKFHPGTIFANREDVFSTKNMWPASSETIINQFLELTKTKLPTAIALKRMTENRSVQMDVEMLLAEGMDLGTITLNVEYHQLRQLMALKFFMVMRIVARMISQNLDIWNNPLTDELNLVGNKLDIALYVSGTSAQVLQYVFDTDMVRLTALAGNPAGKMGQLKDLLEEMVNEELAGKVPAGVTSNLKIYVSPLVQEKREVCFGMLDDNIKNLVAPAAAGGAAPMDPNVKQKLIDKMKTSLQFYDQNILEKYLNGTENQHGLLYYMDVYKKIFFAHAFHAPLPIGGIENISELLTKKNGVREYDSVYAGSRMNVAGSRAAYMVEEEQKPYADLLANTYLIEDILNELIASHQL